ncbi:MAG TPA: PaaI family thioesterase [Rectinemataceae bacterium]|nr:PaaI family thioesterase [Rectinemataceae bacterium]
MEADSFDSFDALVADADYAGFFDDAELKTGYPGLRLPPPSWVTSGAKLLAFESGARITLAFPVREHQTNPIGTLQGGILCSFFDDAFGSLAFASLRRPCVSISMSVDFIRATSPGDWGRSAA